MAAQTEQNFHWLIYFDKATPEPFRERIEKARAVRPFVPVYTGLFSADGWPQSIRETVSEKPAWLLTTRLDNDDGLASDYVRRLHDELAKLSASAACGFNFLNGFIINRGRVYAHSHPSNAFFSWLEPYDVHARTACSIPHMELGRYGPIQQIGGSGAWLQVVHEENVSNKIRGRRVDPNMLSKDFPKQALGSLADATSLSIAMENAFTTPMRSIRDAALSLRRTLRRRLVG